jgi:4Fe-4S ferredoxin
MVTVKRDGTEKRSLEHKNDKCLGCGICVDTCPTSAMRLGPILPIARGLLKSDFIGIDQHKCVLCGLCASSCPFDALKFTVNDINTKDLDNYPKWGHDASIDGEECIYCGKCVTACPRDAIFLQRHLPAREELVRGETEVDQEKCIYCGMCEEMCPADAITIEKNNPSSYKPYIASNTKIDQSKCVYCGICKRICPEEAIKIICTTCMAREEIGKGNTTGEIILDNEKCVNCSWCQEICPVDAAHVTKPFEGEISFTEDFECKGDSCHACADVCPCNAISMVNNHSYINEKFCVLCGTCAKACPQKGIVIQRNEIKLENIRSKAWNTRLNSLKELIKP